MNLRERHAIMELCQNVIMGTISHKKALRRIKSYVLGKRQIVKTCHTWHFSNHTIAQWQELLKDTKTEKIKGGD